jgi:hypothetical protein
MRYKVSFLERIPEDGFYVLTETYELFPSFDAAVAFARHSYEKVDVISTPIVEPIDIQ